MPAHRIAIGSVFVLLLAACGGDDGGAGGEGESAAAEGPEWVEHEAPAECQCADGSEFTFWSRTADPDKVVLYFQGGGACFSPETCSFTDGTYSVQADASDLTDGDADGIFNFENPDNPFRDWSFVFVPYCTGDIHLGDAVHEYSPDLTVNHVGYLNAHAGLQHVVDEFGDASQVFVTGSSAGGVPSPLMAGLLSDEMPDAEIAVLADSSGVYPDNPPVNEAIGSLWGTFNNVPDWPETEGLEPRDFSIPGLFVLAGLHDPDIRMARYDAAYDETQQAFTDLAALSSDDLLTLIQTNEEQIEAAGVPIHSYIPAGTEHTILGSPEMYTLETAGASFLDWLTRYVAGEDVEDVVCTECGDPTP
jgi:Pectinacetylesterase